MKVNSDIVSDNSGSDKCDSAKCSSDMVSHNAGSDIHNSMKCVLTWCDNSGCNTADWQLQLWHELWFWLALTKWKRQHWQVTALDTRPHCWDWYISSIECIMLVDSKDVYWLNWSPSPLRTNFISLTVQGPSRMHCTLYSTSQHIIILWFLFGISGERYSKSSTNNRF